MRLVQLSDIHIGSLFVQSTFDAVVDEVNKLQPDAIVITGDLTDEGILPQYEKARSEIKRLQCPNIIVVAGNHDYRHTGYLLFKKFFPSESVYEFDDAVILTLGTARPDRDEGEVGYRQNLWMEKTLAKYENKVKIVAMHHHLVGIPDTGTDKILILDAGDVLRTCLEAKVNLVMCGHKHRPWVWELGSLEITYAGTTSSTRYRGFFENSYNIIEIKDGNVNTDIKIVGKKRFPLNDLVERYKPFLEQA
ncbi:MAG: metallophosphoesterase family protein [Nitrososphaera sp.]|uniref:metallophosphoesterase family protein n=1 Tax=Nitrososphaera sp. TaxID=1971748 RepID=UPI003D701B7C